MKRIHGIPVRRPFGWMPSISANFVINLVLFLIALGVPLAVYSCGKAKKDRCEEKGGTYFWREDKCVSGLEIIP